MNGFTCRLAALLLGAASTALAQAPRVTPAGDPSVRSDTIYALAVDSARYPDEPFVYLLDDGVVRIEADGRGSRTYRQVIQILTREAVESWAELSFSYSPGRERLVVNWARVVRPDGRVVSAQPTHEQESLAPVAEENPVYTDLKLRRLSLGGVVPGTIVDYSYTVETTQPVMPNDFLSQWRVTTGRLVRRSRLVVDVPATMTPLIKEDNVRFPRRTTERAGRRTYVWATTDVPKLEIEPFAAEANTVEVDVSLAAPLTWNDVARWYAELSRDRYTLTPQIEARLAEIVAGARTLEDSIRAAHRWVAQDFRYVSLSLGIGGFQPRLPAAVFAAQYGDCKDKATLFVALLRRMGVTAYPVLLSQSGGVERELPSPRQFNHMIAALERPGTSGYTFVDLTAELVPFGQLPPVEQGEFALVVHPDGRGEEVTLPEDSVAANLSVVRVEGELSATGEFRGRLTRTGTGSRQYPLREAFSRPLSSTDRDRLTRTIAGETFQGATGDSLEAFDGRDLGAAARLSVAIRGERATSSAGGSDILTLPIDNMAAPGLAAELEARGPRRFPIDAAQVIGPFEYLAELRLTLPAAWRARLPNAVAATSAFGAYRSEYVQDGRLLRVTRRLTGARGILPPDRIVDLIEWTRAMSRDDVRYIVLEHP